MVKIIMIYHSLIEEYAFSATFRMFLSKPPEEVAVRERSGRHMAGHDRKRAEPRAEWPERVCDSTRTLVNAGTIINTMQSWGHFVTNKWCLFQKALELGTVFLNKPRIIVVYAFLCCQYGLLFCETQTFDSQWNIRKNVCTGFR